MADDHRSAKTPSGLYDTDFYIWSQDQAQAIRDAAARGELPASLDWENLADEVGDLGRSEFNAAISLTANIIEHLFLLAASRNSEPHNHWRKEIRAFRSSLRRRLTPAIRRLVEAEIETLHAEIAADVEAHVRDIEPTALPLDASLRWTLAQILGEENDPMA